MRRVVAVAVLLGASAAAWAAAPPVPWSAEQKAKLAERDRLEKSLNGLMREKQFDDLIAAAERILAIEKEAFGETHDEVLGSLERLARWQTDLRQFPEAIGRRKELLRLRERRFGKGHWKVTEDRFYLKDAERLAEMTAQERAELRRADAWGRQVLPSYEQGKVKEAFALAHAAREIREKVQGKKHPAYVDGLHDLTLLYQGVGENDKALSSLREALAITEEVLGKDHPKHARSSSNLALHYQNTGEHAKALPLYKHAVAVAEKALGKGHPFYAIYINNLGELYQRMGEFDKALPLHEESLAIRARTLGKRHPDYAYGLSSLSFLHWNRGERDKALPLAKEALAIVEEVLGKRHPMYVVIVNNLATLHHYAGEYDEALPLYEEVLARRKAAHGEKHPDYAVCLNNLAFLYQTSGKGEKARALYEEALAIQAEVLGKKHPAYALGLNNMASLHLSMGKPKEAVKASAEALRLVGRQLDDDFDRMGERQRGQALRHVLINLSGLLSFQEAAQTPAAERYAAVLAWKGRVSASASLDRIAADSPESRELVGDLRAARSRLASLTLRAPAPAQQAAWLRAVQSLTERKEELEADLARLSAEYREGRRLLDLTPEQLAKRLPAGVAFVDIIEYEHQIPPKRGEVKNTYEDRALAFVSRRGKDVVAVPLGRTKPFADAIARWRAEVEKPPASADREAIEAASLLIRQRVWDALSMHLGDAATVVVAPDGVLCQFPFAALPGKRAGTYLIEDVGIAQVASGAQLFALLEPPATDAKAGKGLLAVGGIDYGEGDAYRPLPGTGPEARRCRDSFAKTSNDGVNLLEGKAATPDALRRAVAARPKYLHLATHGYFEPADKVERLLKGLATQRDGLALWRQQTATFSNLPGLRCGLALSGANAAPPADDPDALPNVLTGDELAQLDLRGCEVAVLSACQTALGDVHRTQGVVGLQRSLHAAGVRTTVTSLWCVQDAATAELMDEFYKNLWGEKKLSRLEALRRAQLTILRDPERVRKRSEALYADAKKRGLGEAALRGIKGRLATDLPEGGRAEDAPKTSPEAWWAAFVLCGDWR